MATATLMSKNLYKVFRPSATDGQIVKLASYLVPVIALVSLYFTFNGDQTIVTLLLMGYSFVTQFFPSLFFSLFRRNPMTKAGAFYGILVGEIVVVYMAITNTTIGSMMPFLPQAVKDLNTGIVALIVNIVVMFIISLFTRNVRLSRHETASEGLE
jgi:SSS family solute:Na+ symporter